MPAEWLHCRYDDTGSGKVSPALSAFRPGATLLLDLPTAWLPARDDAGPSNHASALGGSRHAIPFNLSLQYLTSWQRTMGTAWVVCFGRCACADGVYLHAHRTSSDERNASIFVEQMIGLVYQPAPPPRAHPIASATARDAEESECAVAIRVTNEAAAGADADANSDTALRRFRVRDVVLSTMKSPCHQERVRNDDKLTSRERVWSDLQMFYGLQCAKSE